MNTFEFRTELSGGEVAYMEEPAGEQTFVRQSGDEIDHNSYCISIAMRFVMDNYYDSLSLGRVAAEAGMSVSHFSRHFKRETGMTFVGYLTLVRVSHASRMLLEGRVSMREIGRACGFTTQAYFSRTFRRVMKMSPLQYRGYMRVDTAGPTEAEPEETVAVSCNGNEAHGYL